MTNATFHVAGSSEALALSTREADGVSDYRGHLDSVTPDLVEGWVWDGRQSDRKLIVEILVSGKAVATGIADHFRADLKAVGVGDGAHAFKINVSDAERLRLFDVAARVRGTQFTLQADARLPRRPAHGSAASSAPEAPAPSKPLDVFVAVEARFDTDFYVARNGDAIPANVSALEHFLTTGWREGRSPAPWFSILAYLNKHLDVAADSVNPFLHYLGYGKKEHRQISPADSLQDEVNFRRLKALVADHLDVDLYKSATKLTEVDAVLHYMFRRMENGD